jgi:hypothetical protein
VARKLKLHSGGTLWFAGSKIRFRNGTELGTLFSAHGLQAGFALTQPDIPGPPVVLCIRVVGEFAVGARGYWSTEKRDMRAGP